MKTIYIYLGDKQEANSTDLAYSLEQVIDELCLTDSDIDTVIEILKSNEITFEVS